MGIIYMPVLTWIGNLDLQGQKGGQGDSKVRWEAWKWGQNGTAVVGNPILGPKATLEGPQNCRKMLEIQIVFDVLWKSSMWL